MLHASTLHGVSHDQGRRHGNGVVYLPIDRRGARRSHHGWAGPEMRRLFCCPTASAGGGPIVTLGSNTSRKSAAVSRSIVYIVDDDAALRDALGNLFRSVGLHAELFASAGDFLLGTLSETPSCLVLDVRLPGVSGLEFQGQLAKCGIQMPIVFMTGHGDIPMSVRAMKAGAIDF